MMGDLLKNMRSSQIFSVCGLSEISVRMVKSKNGAPKQYEVELLGLDVFDPVEMVNHKSERWRTRKGKGAQEEERLDAFFRF